MIDVYDSFFRKVVSIVLLSLFLFRSTDHSVCLYRYTFDCKNLTFFYYINNLLSMYIFINKNTTPFSKMLNFG